MWWRPEVGRHRLRVSLVTSDDFFAVLPFPAFAG
jgi:hypothetical protein